MGSAVMTSGVMAVVIAGMREDWVPAVLLTRASRDENAIDLVRRPRTGTAAWVDALDRAPPQRRPPFSPNTRGSRAGGRPSCGSEGLRPVALERDRLAAGDPWGDAPEPR